LCETWKEGQEAQRYLLCDRDSKFNADVVSTVKAVGSQPVSPDGSADCITSTPAQPRVRRFQQDLRPSVEYIHV